MKLSYALSADAQALVDLGIPVSVVKIWGANIFLGDPAAIALVDALLGRVTK